MPGLTEKVMVREGNITLPTYDLKGENRNPVFHSQYGVAHIYPYTLLDDIDAKAKDKTYNTLILENKYLLVTVIPDLGGRVYSVFDKVSQREVFYKNSIVRFAPLAIRGAFFSGGMEFSFPVAHAPTTCDKVNWDLRENADGSASISIGGLEHISRLRWMITLTLFPERCALAQDVFLFNPGTIPGRYHYWTNASLDANDGTEFIYPLHRARSYEYAGTASWPFARLDLILEDPGLPGMEGVPMWPANRLQAPVNFRWQKNMLAQVSIFGRNVEWDYFGAWQHKVNHGYAHVAKSKDVSGMKLWSWGNAPVGVVNQTSLTDDGSVYAETQCGAMETQLDFAFLQPGMTRAWREWWLPLRGMGGLTVASESIGARVSLSPNEDDTVTLMLALCPAMEMENANVRLSLPGEVLLEKTISMSPQNPWTEKIKIKGKVLADNPLSLLVKDKNGNVMLENVQKRTADDQAGMGEQASLPAKESAEGYYQLGLKHENFDNREQAKDAYQKALKLSDGHKDAHLHYGLMLLRSAQFNEADRHFSRASELGNPEGKYYRGLIALFLNNLKEAGEYFKAASKNEPMAAASLKGLGKIAMRQKAYGIAVEHFREACNHAEGSVAPELLLAAALRLAGKTDEAHSHLQNVLACDPLNLLALHEIVEGKYPESETVYKKLHRLLTDDFAYYTDLSCFYLDAGLPEVALDALEAALEHKPSAVAAYLAGYVSRLLGDESKSKTFLEKARTSSPEFGFPSRLEEVLALELALKQNPGDIQAMYFLGNFCYAHERFDEGIQLWLNALKGMESFDVLLRNLGLAYWQRKNDLTGAIGYFQKALAINPRNQDLYLHLDDLYKLLGMNDKREELLGKIKSLVDVREDVHKRSITMLVDLGHYPEAIQLMDSEKFIPLEMDQSFHNTFVRALMQRAAEHIKAGRVEESIQDYLKMLQYPENHGVGAPTTRAQAHIYYQLGIAYEKIGKYRLALQAWREAASEHHTHGKELYPYVQMALDKLSRYSELGLEE
jgi:tetratricopeptide (TPR) repeat protein